MAEVVRFGSNEVIALAPDLYEIRYIGEVTSEPMAGLIDYFRGQSVGKDYILVLGDLRRSSGVTPEARKLAAQAKGILLGGIAFYNVTFARKLSARLVLTAFQLVAKLPFEVHFADTRDEALVWLEARRETLRAARAPL